MTRRPDALPDLPEVREYLACARCGYEHFRPDEMIRTPGVMPPCPACADPLSDVFADCGEGGDWPLLGWRTYEADSCRNCGEVGFWRPSLFCSRACGFQSDYARELGGAR